MKTQATERLAEICLATANAATDCDGFVAVHRLVTLLNSELQARPLLYEGILAAPKTIGGKWVVVVDNSRSGFATETYMAESAAAPLPSRLRFTIAHELGHLLQMQSHGAAEFDETVSSIERQADTLSPLLLVSSAQLDRRLVDDRQRVALLDLMSARKAWAISSDVLVTRLRLLHRFDPTGLRFRQSLRDVAIGIGEWGDGGIARPANWPEPFCNFNENLVPQFLLPTKKDSRSTFAQLFSSPKFILNGGDSIEDVADVFGGTITNPQCERMRLRLTVESTRRGRFIFLVERL